MSFTCCCTNQCQACGQCCAVGCAHRGSAGSTVPVPVWPPGQITVTPAPLTEDDVRRILREEIARDRAERASW